MVFDEYTERFAPGKIAVMGMPLDRNSSFLQGAAQAPPFPFLPAPHRRFLDVI
jgi:hypothetical protein